MFNNIPTVTKNLLIINAVAFLATLILSPLHLDIEQIGGLHFFLASDFHLYQFVTYMFLHGGFAHIFFNMFALWMFGCVIENVWGAKKFIFYYIFCGIGAGLCQEIVQFIEFYFTVVSQFPGSTMGDAITIMQNSNLNGAITIGASGAVYAILLAFGMTFPNERIFIFPLPVPIKAKWFVCIYAAIELFSAMSSAGDGVAHMAHLGGMLFGFLLIVYWRKHPDSHFDLSGSRQFFERWGDRRNAGGSRNTRFSSHSGFSGHSGQYDYSSNNRQSGYGPTREDDMAYNARKKARQEEIDRILDKIRKSGYDSLTTKEKQWLFEASREK